MPSWITHIVTANKILDKVNLDKDKFIFANIMPDILNGHIVKDVSKIVEYEETHFVKEVNFNGINTVIPDIYKFKKIYKDRLDNPIILGYFSHLLTDYYWNFYTYSTYFENLDRDTKYVKVKLNNNRNEIMDWDSAVAKKQKDFKIFSDYLQSMLKEDINFNSLKLWEDIRKLEELKYSKQDIENTVNYLKNIRNIRNNNINLREDRYDIFSQEELLQKLNESVNFIIDILK